MYVNDGTMVLYIRPIFQMCPQVSRRMLTRAVHVAGMTNREVAELVPSGYRMGKPTNNICPDQLYEIMCMCWQMDPVRRPTFETLQDILENFNVATERSYAAPEDAISY